MPIAKLQIAVTTIFRHMHCQSRDQSMKQFIDHLGDIDKSCQALIDVLYCQTEGNDIDKMGMLEFSRAEDCWQYGSRQFR